MFSLRRKSSIDETKQGYDPETVYYIIIRIIDRNIIIFRELRIVRYKVYRHLSPFFSKIVRYNI